MQKTRKIDLKENRAFCILPFLHLHINEKHLIKPCCLGQEQGIKKYTKDFDFTTDPDFQKIREQMIRGERVEHCSRCYALEDKGTWSSRLDESALWIDKLQISNYNDITVSPRYYDIRNDNLCNLSCRMCNPQFSSQLEAEYKTIGWLYPTIEEKSVSFNDIVNIDTVTKIHVAGGEPALLPEFKKFLTRAIEAGRTDIEIRMNTNATKLNRKYCELLSHFTDVNIVVSLDGYDQVNHYIRWPANWQTIVDNVHNLYKITHKIAFNITVSIWNIANLSKLVLFLEQEFPNATLILNKVYDPAMMSFETFPNKELAVTDLTVLKTSRSYDKNEMFRSKVDYYINEMQQSKLNIPALTEFFAYNDALDASRNVKLADYIPELEAGRVYVE